MIPTIGINQSSLIESAIERTETAIENTISAIGRGAGVETIEYHAQLARESHTELKRLVEKFVLGSWSNGNG